MPTLTDKQALDFLSRLFPAGLGDSELLAETCPDGWANSPLYLAFHPTHEQRYDEHLRWLRSPIHELSLRHRDSERKTEPIPTFEEFIAKHEESARPPMSEIEEWTELLGDCLWDILSDNHDLISHDGQLVNLGSFRMVSGLIDDFVEGGPLSEDWGRGDCMRFYMGSSFFGRRTDLGPIHCLIFRRLKSLGYEWRYTFPRIYMISLKKEPQDATLYDPSEAFAKQEEQKAEREETRKRQEEMDQEYAEAKRKAWDNEPPGVVLAYQEIYRKDPLGWPPDPDSTK